MRGKMRSLFLHCSGTCNKNVSIATPYKLGNQAIKFSVVPHATGESFNPENAADKSNYLREAMTQHLASKDACFDFKIQLQTDAVKMPVEDPTIEWNEQ
jgi:hypothetical protein